MITCQLFARAVNGTLQYRGTVESRGVTIWVGSWRADRGRAETDANIAARAIDDREKAGKALSERRLGKTWRVERGFH